MKILIITIAMITFYTSAYSACTTASCPCPSPRKTLSVIIPQSAYDPLTGKTIWDTFDGLKERNSNRVPRGLSPLIILATPAHATTAQPIRKASKEKTA